MAPRKRSSSPTNGIDLTSLSGNDEGRVSPRLSIPDGIALSVDDSLAATLDEHLHRLFSILEARTGHNFSSYKRNTVLRRIERRMAVNSLKELTHYLTLLESIPEESHALSQELLIGMTNFFRDPEAFEFLQREIIPRLLANSDAQRPVRIWHACCATGEEAYSVAMLIQEHLDRHNLPTKVQMFATDLDTTAIARGRAGLYPDEISGDVGQERLRRFFSRSENGWRVTKQLREMIVFAQHNLIKDPPFSRIDLLVCRNFLIYINPDVQKLLIPLFHQVINPGGFLFLGSAETVGQHSNLFAPVVKKWKIFLRQGGKCRVDTLYPLFNPIRKPADFDRFGPSSEVQETATVALAEKRLRERYAPSAHVIINEKNEVVYYSSRAGTYLVTPGGKPTRDLLKMAREELRPSLRAAAYKAFTNQKEFVFEGIRVFTGAGEEVVNIIVAPLLEPPSNGKLALAIFEPDRRAAAPCPPSGERDPDDDKSRNSLIRQLEEQLRVTDEQLQSTSEQLETSNERFISANEELMTVNEELQSTNEELQSTNEELLTVNSELQKKMEELNQSNSDLENLFASSQIATIFLDRDLIIKRFSPAMAAIFNLIPADLGRPFRHLNDTIDMSDLPGDAVSVLEMLVPVEREATSLKDGRSFVMRVLPYRTNGGTADGIVVTLVDISERKKAEQALRQSEQLYRSLFDNMLNGFAYCRMLFADHTPVDFIYLGVNGAFETLTGLKDVVGRKVSEVIPGIRESDPRIFEIYGRVALTGKPERFELYVDSLAMWFSISVYSPKQEYFVAIFDVITERKQAEEKLKMSELRRSLALEASRAGTWEWNLKTNENIWSKELWQLYGLEPSCCEPSYAEWLKVVHPDDRGEAEEAIRQAVADGRDFGIEWRANLGDGPERWLMSRGRPLQDGADRVVRYAGIVLDITDRKRAEEEKKVLHRQLAQAQKLEAIGTLAGGIAHDFNNILGAILGYTELARDANLSRSAIAQNLDKVMEAGQRATDLVRQILAFSRQANVENAPVNLVPLMQEAIRLLRPALPSTITIKPQLSPATSFVLADPTRIHQIMMNLCTNAFHAMEKTGGTLKITLEDCDLPPGERQQHREVKPGKYVRLSVADTGAGIAPENVDKIFHPYFTTKETGRGTGLGLAIVHGIVADLGGRITVKSEPGKGSTFHVFIPAIEVQAPEPVAQDDIDLAGRERILLVDDEEVLAKLGKTTLERLGYRVTVCSGSFDALTIFRNQPDSFDAVITDQTMPKMTGSELAGKILQIRPEIPIILCTGYSSLINEEQAKNLGIKGFAMKPLVKNHLAALLRQVLGDKPSN